MNTLKARFLDTGHMHMGIFYSRTVKHLTQSSERARLVDNKQPTKWILEVCVLTTQVQPFIHKDSARFLKFAHLCMIRYYVCFLQPSPTHAHFGEGMLDRLCTTELFVLCCIIYHCRIHLRTPALVLLALVPSSPCKSDDRSSEDAYLLNPSLGFETARLKRI